MKRSKITQAVLPSETLIITIFSLWEVKVVVNAFKHLEMSSVKINELICYKLMSEEDVRTSEVE